MTFDLLPDLPPERRWRAQAYPAPVVGALIRRQTAAGHPCYLLIRRKYDPYKGQWALVGGKWDFGETLAAAVVREVREETGLAATFVALRGLVSERLAPQVDANAGAHFLIFVCELAAPTGAAEEQAEGAVAWFTLAEIDELHASAAIIPSDYAMIRSFAESAESLPYIEAEMIAAVNGDQAQPARLVRFERVDGQKQ